MKSLLCVTLCLIANFSLGSTAARADALPEDTNKIESLTPEQARKLAKDFPGVTVWVESKRGKFGTAGCLPLNSVKSVDAETAKALAGYAKGPLLLNGLTKVSDEAAKALAEHNGLLSLDGATTLSSKAADALAEHDGLLSLNGLITLSDEVATALARHRGLWLSLDGLTTLSVNAARALAQRTDGLSLRGLTALSDEATKELAQHKGSLNLSGLTTLSDESARVLATHTGDLYLDGLPTLHEQAAKSLAQHKGCLQLNGLTTLSDEAATLLAQQKGELLILQGLTALTNARLAARLVQDTRGGDLSLSSLTSVSAQAAKALAQHKGQKMILSGLTTLDTDTVKALAEFKGVLILNGLTSLDIAAAEALEGIGERLHLKDEFKTKFFADNPLRPDTALAWAVVSQGNLSGVTALDSPDSVAIAKALAAREGPLALPNLKKISPKTLAALLEKEDVEIPLIETLELIQEPDGSVTEDFIIPERHNAR